MALDVITLYCTDTDVKVFISTVGVTLRTDDLATPADGVTMAITDATETMNFYLWQKYSPAFLALSNWVNRRTTVLAAYVLCSRRVNPFPQSLQDRVDKIIAELEAVHSGGMLLPGVPLRRSLAPTYDNVRFDPRYRFKTLRVERNTSSRQPTSQPQVIDYADAFTFEI